MFYSPNFTTCHDKRFISSTDGESGWDCVDLTLYIPTAWCLLRKVTAPAAHLGLAVQPVPGTPLTAPPVQSQTLAGSQG